MLSHTSTCVTGEANVFKRLVGQEKAPEVIAIEAAVEAPSTPEYEVTAYADDLLVRGRLGIRTARLTDLLATTQMVTLHDACATVHSDGHEVELAEIEIQRDELVAMSMAGPRGDPNRRLRRPDLPLLALAGGPFRIWGRAHVPSAADPVAFVKRRGPIVPLTDVVIQYDLAGALVTDELAGLIVNLDLIDSIANTGLLPVMNEAALEAR
jgi:hypothetical protein